MTSSGHVTTLETCPIDSAWALSYRLSIGTIPLSGFVFEIFSAKVATTIIKWWRHQWRHKARMNYPWKFHSNRSSRFLVLLLTKKLASRHRAVTRIYPKCNQVVPWSLHTFPENFMQIGPAVSPQYKTSQTTDDRQTTCYTKGATDSTVGQKLICSFFARVRWKQARAIRRSRIVVKSQL